MVTTVRVWNLNFGICSAFWLLSRGDFYCNIHVGMYFLEMIRFGIDHLRYRDLGMLLIIKHFWRKSIEILNPINCDNLSCCLCEKMKDYIPVCLLSYTLNDVCLSNERIQKL